MIDTSKIYQSNNCGEFRIIKELPRQMVEVMFLSTGFRRLARKGHALRGAVKDLFLPTVYGAGFLGDGRHKATSGGKLTKAYCAWKNMLKRCYDKEFHESQPTYADCSTCDEWLNFQNFAEWFNSNHIDDYQLDKDIKIKGNKIYSPSTCMFVSQADNTAAAHAKSYRLVSPHGNEVEIYNLAEFCRENGLAYSHAWSVFTGRRKTHKGWTKSSARH